MPRHGLRRELGVGSLVLTQILYVVGAAWVGVAATVGNAHAVLWIAATVLFFLPLAMLVASLARLLPLEGGVYRWSEAAFGPTMPPISSAGTSGRSPSPCSRSSA